MSYLLNFTHHFYSPKIRLILLGHHYCWVIPEVVTVAYESGRSLTNFYLKRGFTKVVVTRAGSLREWSQGELRLYLL